MSKSKKRRQPSKIKSTVSSPLDKLRHYQRSFPEDTAEGLKAILETNLEVSRHMANKHNVGTIDLIDSAYGKRRRQAIMNTFPAIINHRGFTDHTKGYISAAEIWFCLNHFSYRTIEACNERDHLLLAASVWLLDHVENRHALNALLASVPREEDPDIPYLYDLRFDEAYINATLYVISNRLDSASERYILDVDRGSVTDPGSDKSGRARGSAERKNPHGTTADAFDTLLSLIDPAALRRAVAHTRALFWSYVDRFFDVECVLAQKYVAAIAAYDSLVDRYNEDLEWMTCAIRKREEASAKALSALYGHGKAKAGPVAGSPLMQPNIPGAQGMFDPATLPRHIEPLGNDIFPAESPFALERAFHDVPEFADPYADMYEKAKALDRMMEQIEAKAEALNALYENLFGFCFDYQRYGFLDTCYYHTEDVPQVVAPILSSPAAQATASPTVASDKIPAGGSEVDPYEICVGLLLLCSPAAFRKLYADVKGATADKDLDLPWLLGAMEGLCSDVGHLLPWGIGPYDMDDIPFEKNRKPLIHTDFYNPIYENDIGIKHSLAQLVYEATGAVIPRDLGDFDEMKAYLGENGVKGKTAVHLMELMSVMEMLQNRLDLPSSVLTDISAGDDEKDGDTHTTENGGSENIEELKNQLKALQERLKLATDAAHAQDRRARKAEQKLAEMRDKTAAERAELAGLREVLFTAEHRDDDHISVQLPYAVQRRTVIFGGHDMWQKPMKEYLTGDVRFIEPEMAAFDTNVIRYADVIWIQTNAIPHKMYYKIMDAARKWKLNVKYFLYGSARKCAEQIVLSERA
ncbi:MAG: hypothetical protein IKQ80_06505 [Clostridia bacterium]|nr:hypothetical protein [Clostridia bacterium]